MPRLVALFVPCILFAAASAQSPAPASAPAFENISVTASHVDPSGYRLRLRDGELYAANITIPALLYFTYGLREEAIVGLPAWTHSSHFDITAKVTGMDPIASNHLTSAQRAQMMGVLLKDRFHLQTHMEPRVRPAQDLVIAQGGPHLLDAGPDAHLGTIEFGLVNEARHLRAIINAEGLAHLIEGEIHQTVVDKTALAGAYSIDLTWTPNGHNGGLPASSALTLPAVIELQLGLKLIADKAPVPTLIIDHIDKPTPN